MKEIKMKEWQILFLLACIQFTHILDFVIIMPLGPQMMRVFSIGTQEFGWIVSSYTFSAGFIGILAAFFIDKFDRKTILNTSYLGFTIGTLLCAFAPNHLFFTLARIFAGGFGGLIGALIFTIIGDIVPYERRGKATGVVMSAFSIATVAGVPIGLYLATNYGWQIPFLSLGILSTIVLIFSHFVMPSINTHSGKKEHNIFEIIKMLFGDINHIKAFLLMITMMLSSFSVIPYISPYMVSNVGLTENELSYIYFFGGAFTFFTARFVGKLSDKFGKPIVFMILALLSFIPILLVTHLGKSPLYIALIVTTLFFIVVSGRMIPAMAMITASVHPKNRGSFMSLNTSIQQIGAGLAAMISGYILTTLPTMEIANFQYVGYMAVGFGIISIIVARSLKSLE